MNTVAQVISRNRPVFLFFGIFMISLSVLMFEITLTRIFSVILSYHYVFMVVSIALSGYGVGGAFLHLIRSKIPIMKSFKILSMLSLLFSLALPLSIVLVVTIPYTEHLIVYFAITFIPFFLAGIILASVFDNFTEHSSRLTS